MEFRAGSLSGRLSPLVGGDSPDEIIQSGYLNRKCVSEAGARKSKDRSWITLWCSIKGTILEFHRVEAVSPRPQGAPPPKELFPPPSQKQTKHGFVDLLNSLVDIDYTSQMNKDLQKRRSFLFQLVLSNQAEYIFQAPAEKNRTQWVMAIKQASRDTPTEDPEASLQIHSLAHSIKSSRDSIKQKSRQNVHSVKKQHTSVPIHIHGKMGSIEESELLEVPVAQSMMGGDPQLRLLKKRLHEKRELLKHLKTMYTSFMGGSGALYADALIHHEGPSPEHHPSAEKGGVVHRRMSLPEVKGQDEGDDKRFSTGDYSIPITTPLSPGVRSIEGVVETELLVDYYLVPGAKWSLLKKGETVRVLGQATNGWYQCMAMRNTTVTMDFEASGYPVHSSLSSGVSDLSISNESEKEGVAESKVNGESSKVNQNSAELGVEAPNAEKTNTYRISDLTEMPEEEQADLAPTSPAVTTPTEVYTFGVSRTQSYKRATASCIQFVKAKNNVGRTESYKIATEETDGQFEDGLLAKKEDQKRRKAATVGRSTSSVTPSSHSNVRLRQSALDRAKRRSESASLYVPGKAPSPQPWRLGVLLDRERQTGKYSTPMIGCVAPSALKYFADKVVESLSSSGDPPVTSDLSVSTQRDSDLRPDSSLSGELVSDLQNLVLESEQATDLNPDSERSPSVDLIESQSIESGLAPDSERSVSIEPGTELDRPISPPEEVALRTELLEAQPPVAKQLGSDQIVQSESETVSRDKDTAISDEFMLMNYQEEPKSVSPVSTLDRESRARSLPPPVISHTPPSSPLHNGVEPLPDRGNSVEKETTTPSVSKSKGKRGSYDSNAAPPEQKTSLLKKIFKRGKPGRSASSPSQTPEHEAALASVTKTTPTHKRQRPHTISRKPRSHTIQNDDSFFDSSPRLRVSSVSGRPVRREGVGLVIGESSSESEDENGEEEMVTVPEVEGLNTGQSQASSESVEPKPAISRQISDSVAMNRTSNTGMKRSASDHDSLALKAGLSEEVINEQELLQPKSTQSLKRGLKPRIPSFSRKARSNTDSVTSPVHKAGKKQKKSRGTSVSDNYKLAPDQLTPGTPETNTKWDVIFRAPPRGEKRYVYLDPQEGTGGKYGFRLQSYGRIREQGKVLQTFVQSVVPGSVSFLAGLYPGDAIIEVNGTSVKYAPVEDVVKAIQEGALKMERIALVVEFVDGVTRLEGMKRSDDVKHKIKEKQSQLKRLIDQSNSPSPPTSPPHSPYTITPVTTLTPWGETTPASKPRPRPFEYDRHLNNVVALHRDSVAGLQCDVLVMPLSSCHQPTSGTENALLHLLKTSGEDLMNELSLAKQCRLGENIITGGYNLHANSIYHCVFGNLEESLQKCCNQALRDASSRGHRTITFWLDGFVSIAVSPQIIIETVRQWLGGNNSVLFDRVVFAAKANLNIIENFLEDAFPLEQYAQRDSMISEHGNVVNLEPEPDNQNQNETSDTQNGPEAKLSEAESEKIELQNGTLESEEDKPPLFLTPPTEEEVEDEDEDMVGDLPEISDTRPRPLLERTSISEIGIQLSSFDDDLEDGNLDLNLSESDSEPLESNSGPSLLSGLNDNSEPRKTQPLAIGGSPNHASRSLISPYTPPLSRSVPTRGLVVLIDNDNTPSSAGSSPRSYSRSPSITNLVLNPDRQESDV